MSLEESPLNATERASAEKWIAGHKKTNPAHDRYDVDSIVGGYGYRLKVVCLTCGQREDVTDNLSHGGYPHK
jgi:hypothetical protein